MEMITTVHERTGLCYLTCASRGTCLIVTTDCSCGWAGPTRSWGPDSIGDEQADLDAHIQATGHRQLEPGHPPPTTYTYGAAMWTATSMTVPSPTTARPDS